MLLSGSLWVKKTDVLRAAYKFGVFAEEYNAEEIVSRVNIEDKTSEMYTTLYVSLDDLIELLEDLEAEGYL
jgi:hypothetical protein